MKEREGKEIGRKGRVNRREGKKSGKGGRGEEVNEEVENNRRTNWSHHSCLNLPYSVFEK